MNKEFYRTLLRMVSKNVKVGIISVASFDDEISYDEYQELSELYRSLMDEC